MTDYHISYPPHPRLSVSYPPSSSTTTILGSFYYGPVSAASTTSSAPFEFLAFTAAPATAAVAAADSHFQPQYPTPSSPIKSLESIPHPIITTLGPLPPNDLPIYSASGFDMLDILARVATRPNPKVSLGPVDMTASFVVVDTTKADHPIAHLSPGFTHLTGYTEADILERNASLDNTVESCLSGK